MNNYEALHLLRNIFDSNEFIGISFMILGISLFALVFYNSNGEKNE